MGDEERARIDETRSYETTEDAAPAEPDTGDAAEEGAAADEEAPEPESE